MKKIRQTPIIKSFSWKFLLIYFLFLFSTLSLFSSGTIESQDGWLYLSVARNIYYKHKIVANPQTDYPKKNVNMNSQLGKDGEWRAPGSTGYSVAMIPAVALSDLLLRHYQSTPPQYFPLESDWTVLFFASFTNSFLTALMGIGILLYAKELGLTKKQSLATSFIGIFATMLLILSKNAFAHPLYICGLLFAFYSLKRFSTTKGMRYILFAILSFAITYFSYNEAYILAIPALGTYLLFNLSPAKQKILIVLAAVVTVATSILKPNVFQFLLGQLIITSPKLFIEGMFGLLFSPGKSIFLYSPILILFLIFWSKLLKKILPEIISVSVLFLSFIFVYAKAWILGASGNFTPIWYGGQAWGPRYISPVIPFLAIFTAFCFFSLKKWQKICIAGPILLVSLWVQLVGVSIPYILQYRDLPSTINVGSAELSYYEFASFIPRYSPILSMSAEFARKIMSFKGTVDHGSFHTIFYDGFEVPVHTGIGYIRGFRKEGHISIKLNDDSELSKIFIRFDNIPDTQTATASGKVHVHVNNVEIGSISTPPNSPTDFSYLVPKNLIHTGVNAIDLTVDFSTDSSLEHVQYITQMTLDDQNINLGSLDYPDVSTVGQHTTPIAYQYFGNRQSDPWVLWYLRARINERTFDLWWIKNLYYWDKPQMLLFGLFVGDVTLSVSTAIYLLKLTQDS
ncbi:MAG TPA: hypothetical protein VLH19_00830 [Patescibacteria group bacterium]|nr:hypothetical protein [Patescibacteria group bacterium]